MQTMTFTRTYDGRTFTAQFPLDAETGNIPSEAPQIFEREAAVLLAKGAGRGPQAFRLFCNACGLDWIRLAERFHVTPEMAQAWMRGKTPAPAEVWGELAAEVLARRGEPVPVAHLHDYPIDTVHAVEVTEAAQAAG